MRVHDPHEFEHLKNSEVGLFKTIERYTTQGMFGNIDIGDLVRLSVIGSS